MISSGFFDDVTYKASNFTDIFAAFISNGVVSTKATNLQVISTAGMQIAIQAGYGWINGCYMYNDNNYLLTLDMANGLLSRIDRVVMRWDNLLKQVRIVLLVGVFAENPVAPALVRDGTYYDLSLATITVGVGVTEIIQADITDTRFLTSQCGVVTGMFTNINTEHLFAQYESEWNRFTMQMQAQSGGAIEIIERDVRARENLKFINGSQTVSRMLSII